MVAVKKVKSMRDDTWATRIYLQKKTSDFKDETFM